MLMKSAWMVTGLVLALGVGGWAVGASSETSTSDAATRTAERFQIAQGGGSALLLDTATGRVWFLERSASGAEGAWIPCRAFNDLKDARKWQEFQELRRRQMQKKAEGRQARPVTPFGPR
jgi:hypothetical protein